MEGSGGVRSCDDRGGGGEGGVGGRGVGGGGGGGGEGGIHSPDSPSAQLRQKWLLPLVKDIFHQHHSTAFYLFILTWVRNMLVLPEVPRGAVFAF